MKLFFAIILVPIKLLFTPIFLFRFWLLKSLSKKYNKHGEVAYPDDERYTKIRRLISRLFWMTNTKVEVIGKENIPKKASLFAPNHKSVADPLALIYILQKLDQKQYPIFIAKKELEKGTFGAALKICDSLFLDRDNIRQALGLFKVAAQKLRSGKPVVVFPEGTRNPHPGVREFKAGAFKIAYQAHAPIVPVTIIKSEASFAGFIFSAPTTITVVFHNPIMPNSFLNINSQVIAEKVRKEVLSGLRTHSEEDLFEQAKEISEEVHNRIKKPYMSITAEGEEEDKTSIEVVKPNNKEK